MSRPVRVAHLVGTSGHSGTESYLRVLLPSFERAEFESVLFAPGPGPLVDELRARGVRVELGAPTRKLAFGDAQRLAARLRGGFDLIHSHGPRVNFWAPSVARMAGIEHLVFSVHELRWHSLPPGFQRQLYTALDAWANPNAERLLVLSRKSAEELGEREPRVKDRIVVVPCSAPMMLERPLTTRPHVGRNDGPLRVLTIGRFHWVKGHDRLLEGCARAVARGVELELIIAGHGPDEAALQAQVARLGLAARVRWIGSRFDLWELLEQSQVYASGSRFETFGIAALEAMAGALPTVVTETYGFRDVVAHGETGLLVPLGSDDAVAEGLARGLQQLSADPARRAAMGAAGLARAQAKFSPPVMAAAHAAIYRDVLARGSAAR